MNRVIDLYPTVELIKQAIIDGKLEMRYDSIGGEDFVGIFDPETGKHLQEGLSKPDRSALYTWWEDRGN